MPDLSLTDVHTRLSSATVEQSMAQIEPGLRRSAVVVLVSGADDGVELLFTRRSWDMRTHRGEVSFAGGGEEAGDDFPVGTALREACEEVSLDVGLVRVAGALGPLTTFTSDRVVVPVVGTTTERPSVVASPAEVDAILHVPLAELLEPGCYHEELWSWSGLPDAGLGRADDHPMHFFDIVGDTIWGATANMVHQLLTLLLVGEPVAPGPLGPEPLPG